MTAHRPAPTPTPWTLIWHGNEKYPYPLSVMSQDGTGWVARDGQVSSEANARLIVTAVNAHAPLVEACRAALARINGLHKEIEGWKDRHGIAYTVVRLTRQKAEDRR